MKKKLNYETAHHKYYVCTIYNIPRILHPPLSWYMKQTNKGMQMSVWLRKNKSDVIIN